jgi:hypothetical protein
LSTLPSLGLSALLLVGCAQTPAAPTVPAGSFTIAPPATGAQSVLEATPGSGPQTGLWELEWQPGQSAVRHDQLKLQFLADGSVEVDSPVEAFGDYPNQWSAEHVKFEGLPRRDFVNTSAVSRDRLDLAVESSTQMAGTLSIRVNNRWIPFPVTARLITADKRSALAVTPGTIVDTTAPEQFD